MIEINSHSNQMDHKEINDEEPRKKGTEHIMHEIKDHLSAIHKSWRREKGLHSERKDEDEEKESHREKQCCHTIG